MNNFDIIIRVKLSESAWHKVEYPDLNFDGETLRFKGIREPLKTLLLDMFLELKEKFSNVALVDYGTNSEEWEDNCEKIILINFSNPDKCSLIAELINNFLSSTTLVESITVNFFTSKSETLYKEIHPKLFSKYKGRVPLSELYKTILTDGDKAILRFFMQNIIDSLQKYNVEIDRQEENGILIITKKDSTDGAK